MEENARRFARKILVIHMVLLALVVTLVCYASKDIYEKSRDQATEQARQRQVLLANQTARGIESFYESVQNDLELLGRSEGDDAAKAPRTRPFMPRAPLFGPLLWNQLKNRASHLFTFDKELNAALDLGNNDPGISVAQVVDQSKNWLDSVDKPSISKFVHLQNRGVNLVCVPSHFNPRRMLVAVVPISEIEARFLNTLNTDKYTAAFLVDETRVAMAASSPSLVGANFDTLNDPQVVNLVRDYVATGRSGTEIISKSLTLGSQKLWPSMVTAMPVNVTGGKTWQLLVASPLSEIDRIVNTVFRKAMLWAIFVIFSVTCILVSTGVSIIRGRIRQERIRHDLLRRELDKAREIQLAWLPREHQPATPAIDLAAVNQPASHVSGDFYNWFDLPDGRTVVTIGDVTGHGMAAAFLMATTQLLVRATMMRVGEASRCLEEVNKQLCVQAFNGQFVTMLIVIIDVANNELEIATAGHPNPMISNGNGFQVLPIEPQLILGVEPDATFTTTRVKLAPHSKLILFTDGVPDCLSPGGQRFRLAGLQSCLHSSQGDAQDLLDTVLKSVTDFRQSCPLGDDLTLVVLHVQRADGSVNVQVAN